MISKLSASAAFIITILTASAAMAEPDIGSTDWHFNMSKAIAIELADTPLWTLATPYLNEISPKTQDWHVLLIQAKVELQQGNIPEAESVIQRALSFHPQNPRILAMAGNIAADSGKQDDAIGYFEKTLSLQPDNTQILLSLGRIRTSRREWDKAILLLEHLLELTSPTAEINSRLAQAYENIGNYSRAEHFLIDNLDVHPNRVLALMPLERFYRSHQNIAKADEIAREIKKYRKSDGDNRVMRALPKSSR